MDKLLIGSYVVTTAGGLIMLKLGTGSSGLVSVIDGRVSWNISILTILGIFMYGISFLLYIFLISKFNLGFIVPLTTALVYMLVFSASYFLFKESFTSLKILAIVMIIGGVILLNLNPNNDNHNTPETLSVSRKK